jgi:hypothetical protein
MFKSSSWAEAAAEDTIGQLEVAQVESCTTALILSLRVSRTQSSLVAAG